LNAFKKESNAQCTNGGGGKWSEGYVLVTCHNLFPFRPLQVKLYLKQPCEYEQWGLFAIQYRFRNMCYARFLPSVQELIMHRCSSCLLIHSLNKAYLCL